MKLLDHALKLASQGFRVFPLVPKTKLPAITEWPKAATCDEQTIRLWWSGKFTTTTKAGKALLLKPDCNIGICPKDDYVIIDIDLKGDYRHSLELLKAKGLPPTYTVRTPSGGLHLYYHHPGGYIKSLSNWMPGLDIRGNAGQGVGPGSVVEGIAYTVEKDLPIAALPADIAMDLPVTIDKQERTTASTLVTQKDTSPYSKLPDAVAIGERDDVLFKYACSWRARNYTLEHAQILMKDLYSRCAPDPPEWTEDPFTLDKALLKVERAWAEYNQTTAANWINLVTPSGDIEVETRDITTIKDALSQYLYVEKLNRVVDLMRHPKSAVLTLQEFKNAFSNVYIGKKQMPPKWLGHPRRKTVSDIGYKPAAGQIYTEDGAKNYNLYYGSGLVLPQVLEPAKLTVPLEHFKFMFPLKEAGMLFIQWLAFTIQHPEIRIPWAPLIISSPGVGKGYLYNMIQRVVGRQNCSLIGPEDFSMGSKFNEFMAGKIVCLDEMRAAGKFNFMNKLKPLMTENELEINRKFGSKKQERIYVNFICFSNYGDAAALTYDDRRFWCHYVPHDRRSPAYYNKMFKWLDTDGPAHLEKWLRGLDLSDFHHAAPPPMTDAKVHMIEASMSPIKETLVDGIMDEYDIFAHDIVSAQLVEKFLAREVDDLRLDAKTRVEIRKAVADITRPLPQSQYRVTYPGVGNTRRVRMRCIRNKEHWANAVALDIVNEYLKSWAVGTGATTLTESSE